MGWPRRVLVVLDVVYEHLFGRGNTTHADDRQWLGSAWHLGPKYVPSIFSWRACLHLLTISTSVDRTR